MRVFFFLFYFIENDFAVSGRQSLGKARAHTTRRISQHAGKHHDDQERQMRKQTDLRGGLLFCAVEKYTRMKY